MHKSDALFGLGVNRTGCVIHDRRQTRELFIGSLFCVTAFISSSQNVLQATAALAYSYGYELESAYHICDSRNLHKPTA